MIETHGTRTGRVRCSEVPDGIDLSKEPTYEFWDDKGCFAVRYAYELKPELIEGIAVGGIRNSDTHSGFYLLRVR